MFTNNKKEEQPSRGVQTNSFIAKGTRIQGDVTAEGSLRVEGEVEGQVHTNAKLVTAPGAKIKGNITAQHAEISSLVEGNLKISELLTLKAEAVIRGDIQTVRLVVESGAQFDGSCSMRVTSSAAATPPARNTVRLTS